MNTLNYTQGFATKKLEKPESSRYLHIKKTFHLTMERLKKSINKS